MILGFFALMIVVTFGASFLSMSMSSLVVSKRDGMRARALANAEAGIDKAISFLMFGGPSGEAKGAWRTTHPSAQPDNHNGDTWYEPPSDDATYPSTGDDTYKICARDGSGITAGKIVITSVGTATTGDMSTSRKLKVIVRFNAENVSVWNNVIFGGVGQAGKSINGNVVIRGSVHLLGDGEPYTDLDSDGHWDIGETYTDSNHNGQYNQGEPYTDTDGDGHRDAREPYTDVNGNGSRDPALTVTDMAEELSGTANVGNNYNGMSGDLRSRVPNPPLVSFGGETVDSLSAKLRVKHGRVNISGSATAGNPNTTGNGQKETLNGAYVSDGFGGNQGTSSVHADNGYSNGYDLGDGVVTLPVIDSGAYTKGGVTYANYLAYLQATATVYTGNLTVNKGTALSITGPNGSLVIDAAGNMTISGKVYVTGTISFGPSKSRIIYQGSGTIVTPMSTYVHCDLLPKTNFPVSDALGLIAGDKIELATGGGDAQLTMALAMYAQHKVISQKQSEIAGTIVASYYEMTNVPKIYQVPELVNHLPPDMPGGQAILIANISTESWQEIPN